MTDTFGKEWLENVIQGMEECREEIPFGLDEDGNNTLQAFKIALNCLNGPDMIAPSGGSPSPERDKIRQEHAEWSQVTFGNVGPIGPLKHLRREVKEVLAKPHDLSEWADMQFLMWDAQRRAGFSDEQITRAMVEKLAVNKSREWPEPKDGEARLHIQSPPPAKTSS